MKKIILVLLVLTFKLSFAQTGWFWQNPLPQGAEITDVKFINTNTAIATTVGCSVMKSLDKGATWTVKKIFPVDLKYFSHLHSINIINTNTIFVMQTLHTSDFTEIINKILKSTDEGVTWTSTNIPEFNYLNEFSIKFINYNTGFAFGTNFDFPQIYKTTNSGESWTRFSINGNDSLTQFYFLNENTGWIGSAKNKDYYKTTNAGLSWTTNTLNIPSSVHWNNSFFLNENTGWISAGYKTTDGGTSWVQQSFSFNNEILFINELTGFRYGSDISKTTNGGINWVNAMVQEYSSLAISNNNLNGIAVGKYGKMLITSNAGTTWIDNLNTITFLSFYPENYQKIYFADANTGWFNTWLDDLYKSTNGGINWLRQSPGVSVFDFNFANQNTGLIGAYDRISRTTNGGINWTFFYTSETCEAIPYFKNDTAYAQLRSSQRLIRSTNGGVNWTDISSSAIAGGKLHFLNSRIIFSAVSPALCKSTNGGANWTTLNYFFGTPLYNTYFINENTGFVTLDSGIYKTTDGGTTFTLKQYLPISSVNNYQFINDRTGWAAGSNSVLLKTVDAGDTWIQNNNTESRGLYSICFINDNTGWVCGADAVIIKTTTGGTIGIQQISTSLPDKYYLSQNYPNPFNPNTVISFQLPAAGFVKLKVFDLLGREVANLVNENLSAGSYKYDFNASALPSGIYFYNLETENFSETKKMVLVK